MKSIGIVCEKLLAQSLWDQDMKHEIAAVTSINNVCDGRGETIAKASVMNRC